ncbi:MAG: PAS domain-containing sensor histidine kinase [Rhizobacter sp.]|nr:PAS domain-containing sensor histidine kinase [Rhizobacter sp.]
MLRKALAQGRMRWLMIGPFLVVVALLATLAVASVDILSAVRAYVGGESLWSKGQKDAVFYLNRYIDTHDPVDYLRFQNALAVPLGDRRARLALGQDPPDIDTARLGFLAGGNHPDDVEGMIDLFLRFRRVSFMADAITIWAAADDRLADLNLLALQVHEHIRAGDSGSPELQVLLAGLPELNTRLTELEELFSATLGQASRTARRLVLIITLVLAAGLTAGGLSLTAYMLRQQAEVEHALRESNERWALAAEAAGMGLFEWDLHSGHASVDARAAALYGLHGPVSGVELSALTRDMVHPEDAARFRAAVSQLIAHPAPATQRYRLLLPGGVVRHIEAIANVSRNSDNVGVRMVGVLRDVSDQIRAAELQLEKEAAERAYRAKGEFLSRVSHELRTPLNAVLGFAQLVQTDPVDVPTPAQKQRMGHVLDAGRHLLSLINDILDLSSLDESAAPLPVVPVALAPALQQSLSHVETLARTQQVALEVVLPERALCVLANARRLEQVFTNLLSNAIKYNRVGGEVAVLCECVDDEVRVTVRDTGPGLRPDQVERLFQPFNRVGAEFSKVQGSGLGLVITQQLIKHMGGSLQVLSTVGVGTRMVVRLRAAPLLDQVAVAT